MMEVGFAWRSIGEEERATAPHMASKIQRKGTFFFKKGRSGSVVIGTAGTDGKYVIVDAVQFLFVGGRKG